MSVNSLRKAYTQAERKMRMAAEHLSHRIVRQDRWGYVVYRAYKPKRPVSPRFVTNCRSPRMAFGEPGGGQRVSPGVRCAPRKEIYRRRHEGRAFKGRSPSRVLPRVRRGYAGEHAWVTLDGVQQLTKRGHSLISALFRHRHSDKRGGGDFFKTGDILARSSTVARVSFSSRASALHG